MTGGGNVLSKEAVRVFNEVILPNNARCNSAANGIEDWTMGAKWKLVVGTFEKNYILSGECLKGHAVFVDSRDEHHQKRFFPVGVDEHMKRASPEAMKYWYYQRMYYQSPQGSPDCCSDAYIASHYVPPKEAYLLDYIIYHVHPFGLEKPNELPAKLSFEDVKKAGEVPPYQQAGWRKEDEAKKAATTAKS